MTSTPPESNENRTVYKPEKVISRESIHRLISDIKEIIKNPLTSQNIYYSHHESDMLKGYALIIGPEDTIYDGGFYFFEFNFPYDYPYSPPKVTYCTNDGITRFNPNLYRNGKVCVSILNTWTGDQWSSCQSITSVLLTLCTLLNSAPFLNEPGIKKTHPEYDAYHKIIEYKNYNVAILDMITKTNGIYPLQFDPFYCFMREYFINNYDRLLDKINKYVVEQNNTPEYITCKFYNMAIKIDYNIIMNRFKEVYSELIK